MSEPAADDAQKQLRRGRDIVLVEENADGSLVCVDCSLLFGRTYHADEGLIRAPLAQARHMLDHVDRHTGRGDTVPTALRDELVRKLTLAEPPTLHVVKP